MKEFNLVAFGTDSYKQTHYGMYPDGLQTVYSYCEPRVGGQFKEVVFFGLQYIVEKYLYGRVVTQNKIDEAAEICAQHFGSEKIFNREGWEHILLEHDGHLPIKIMALREGTVVPEGTALFTIENTDPRVPWLTNFLETLLMNVWSPCTVATGSREVKRIIKKYLELTGTPEDINFKLHDFGYRGVSSLETSALTGAAHLVNFMGTDTMSALQLCRDYYHEPMAGFSIPATEHSVMTAGGPAGEADVVRKILAAHPQGLVAMVIDSYDTEGFITNVIGGNPDIKEAIIKREGTVVFRPDSGELPDIDVTVFNLLEKVFGSSVNEKGFRVLPPYIRMIQGDGIKWQRTDPNWSRNGEKYEHTVEYILRAFYHEGISADNIAFGSGGGLLQAWDRDTQRFAMKCSAMQINGVWVDIFKEPKTDTSKNSKRGRLAVVKDVQGHWRTITQDNLRMLQTSDSGIHNPGSVFQNYMSTLFENGKLHNANTLADIREQAKD